MTDSIPYNDQITTAERSIPKQPQIKFRPKYRNRSVYYSDINLTLDARFSQYGAIEIRAAGKIIYRQNTPGPLSSYKSYPLETKNNILEQGAYIEVYVWNPINDEPVEISVNFSYSLEPLEGGAIGESRSSAEARNEISEGVGGLDKNTLDLLSKLQGIKAAINDQALTLDTAAIVNKINTILEDVQAGGQNLNAIQAAIGELFTSLGGQEIASDTAGILAQLQALLDEIQKTDLEVNTGNLESLIKQLTAKTIPDDLGLSDGIIATLPPPNLNAAGNRALVDIRAGIIDLINGFDLYELQNMIDTLDANIIILENESPDLDLTGIFRLLRMRLKRQHETIPSLKQAESSSLFPKRVYKNEIHTNVIDTKGHTHFVASMTTDPIQHPINTITGPTSIRPQGLSLWPRQICGTTPEQLATYWQAILDNIDDESRSDRAAGETVYDLRDSITEKEITILAQLNIPTISANVHWYTLVYFTLKIETATNPEFENATTLYENSNVVFQNMRSRDLRYALDWPSQFTPSCPTPENEGDTRRGDDFVGPPDDGTHTLTSPFRFNPTITDRYVRVKYKLIAGYSVANEMSGYHGITRVLQPPPTYTVSLGIRNHGTGIAALSFELKDDFDNWNPVITAAELGTIIQGGNPVIVRFNERTFGFPLPASRTIFRAKLTVSNGSINTGVSLTLLS